MRRPRGRRSSYDVEAWTWTCSNGHTNPPESHEFFDIPALVCGCGCGEEFEGDFDFSLANITVNGQKLVGKLLDQGSDGLCLSYSFAKQMEIIKRTKAVLLNKTPTDSLVMNPKNLNDSVHKILGVEPCSAPTFTALIMMAQVLKQKGILSEDGNTIYKASNIETISKKDTVRIVRELADGFALNAGFAVERRLSTSRYCRPYKPPSNNKMWHKFQMSKRKASARKPFIAAHAVVLVGARRKNRKLDYHYMNSWKDFCIRRDKYGRRLLTYDGFGKIGSDCLLRNVVRISRFKEHPTDRSFVPESLPLNLDTGRNFSLLID